MLNFLLTAEAPDASIWTLISSMWPMLLVLVVFYFLLMRPQKKREKATQEMRSRIEVGDEIVTVGGIIGRVVSIKDDMLVLETASERSKVRIMRWAIQSNNTVHDDLPAEK